MSQVADDQVYKYKELLIDKFERVLKLAENQSQTGTVKMKKETNLTGIIR